MEIPASNTLLRSRLEIPAPGRNSKLTVINRIHGDSTEGKSRVAPVTSRGSPTERIGVPGVMDTEGRVDESRLRLHIFQNGNNSSVHHHVCVFQSELNHCDMNHIYIQIYVT